MALSRRCVLFKAEIAANSDQDPYVEALNAAGASAEIVPTLQFDFVNLERLSDALKRRQFSALAMASPRAAAALAKVADASTIRVWRTIPIFAVGQRTASAAEDFFGRNAGVQGRDSGNADKLAPIVANAVSASPFPVLLPCGNLSEHLHTALEKANVKVEPIVCYESKIHPELASNVSNMALSQNDIIVFFSPSGVKNVLPTLGDLSNGLNFCAIGPTTRKAIEENGLKCLAEAEKPNPEELVKAILKFFTKQ